MFILFNFIKYENGRDFGEIMRFEFTRFHINEILIQGVIGVGHQDWA